MKDDAEEMFERAERLWHEEDDPVAAAELYLEIRRDYPDSEAATGAKRALERLVGSTREELASETGESRPGRPAIGLASTLLKFLAVVQVLGVFGFLLVQSTASPGPGSLVIVLSLAASVGWAGILWGVAESLATVPVLEDKLHQLQRPDRER